MSDRYKFEMIRFDESAQITTCHSVKTRGVSCTDVVSTFADFLQACGFHRESITKAYQHVENELSQL